MRVTRYSAPGERKLTRGSCFGGIVREFRIFRYYKRIIHKLLTINCLNTLKSYFHTEQRSWRIMKRRTRRND